MRKRPWLAALAGLPILLSGLFPAPSALANTPVKVIVNGSTLNLNPAPIVVGERTMVPVRGLFEAMGAQVHWDEKTRSVTVASAERYIQLKMDKRMVCLSRDCTDAGMLDVPMQIVGDRTFVPLRFVSQALGARVTWNQNLRAVVVETDKAPDAAFAPVTLPGLTQDMRITGPIQLRASGPAGEMVHFYAIDPKTGKGPIIAAGPDSAASYTYTPDPTHAGARLIIAGIRDKQGTMHYSQPVRVQLQPDTTVRLTGIDWGGVIDGPINFGNQIGFTAYMVEYYLIDEATGQSEFLGFQGANERMTWYPQIGHNGDKRLQVVAYDRSFRSGEPQGIYRSEAVPVKVQSGYRQVLAGVTNGQTLTGGRTFSVTTNYPVESVRWSINGQVVGWGMSHWFAAADQSRNGDYSLTVRITAQDGHVEEIGPINFKVNVPPTVPTLRLTGVGPRAVITGPVDLRATANVPVGGTVKFYLNGSLLGEAGSGQVFKWTPTTSGDQSMRAEVTTASGTVLRTETVNFKTYLGTIYGKYEMFTRSEDFLKAINPLAIQSYHETGMAASLQVAQSILETGWGKSIPRDKYTGRISYNMFGIKGIGPAGSVTITTWEEYNGVAVTVDDNFRAYNNLAESWKDHKEFLMVRPWYAPVRAVIADPIQAAWALQRSGYATDSRYPIKLIDIMNRNNLYELDNVEL